MKMKITLLFLLAISAYSNQLEYVERIADDSAVVNGLAGARCVLLSKDNQFIYVAGEKDNSICWFSRLSSGKIEFSGRVKNDSNNVTGLESVFDMVFSRDERFLYAVTYFSNTLVWFSRSKETGMLTFKGKLAQDTNSVEGLYVPIRSVLSPSGKHLYTVSNNDSTIGLFVIDSISGAPTYKNVYKDGISTVDGLAGAYDICIVPDEYNAYIVATRDSSLTVFNREKLTGELTFSKKYTWKTLSCSTLIHPTRVISSSDGKYIYVASHERGSIAWFSRDLTTGFLYLHGEIIDNQNGVDGLYNQNDMKLFNNGQNLILTGFEGVSLLKIDKKDGGLSFVEFCRDARPINVGFTGTSIAFTSDYKDIYVTDFGNGLHILNFFKIVATYRPIKGKQMKYNEMDISFYNFLGQKISNSYITRNKNFSILILKEESGNCKFFSGILPIKMKNTSND